MARRGKVLPSNCWAAPGLIFVSSFPEGSHPLLQQLRIRNKLSETGLQEAGSADLTKRAMRFSH